MDRRNFMKLIASTAIYETMQTMPVISSKAFAMPGNMNHQKLLVIFLRGAYDGLNLLVPFKETFYYQVRPNIGLKIESDQSKSLIPISGEFALHPALKENILPLFLDNQVSFIHAAGSPDNSRSHFHAQDVMEYGIFDDSNVHSNGFLYRLYDVLKVNRAVSATSYTNNLPLIMKGYKVLPNVSLKGNMKFNLSDAQVSLYDRMYQGNNLSSQVTEGFDIHKNAARYEKEMTKSGRGANTSKGFSEETVRVARFMRNSEGMAIGFVDVGGWDTHVGEGSYSGALANNLRQLSEGLVAYRNAMNSDWENTTVVVMSEFGRTVRENGNQGTDHGHGNVVWVLGGHIKGGKILGEWEELNEKTLHEDRDLPVLNDYRNIFASIFTNYWDMNKTDIQKIFPGLTFTKFDI